MKRAFILLTLIYVFILSSCEKNKTITLSGKIENLDHTPLLISDDERNAYPDTIAVKNGEFSASITTGIPGFKYLIFGKSIKEIFLAPGYSLKIIVSPTTVKDSCSFKIEEEGAAENYILDSMSARLNNFGYSKAFKMSPDTAPQYIDSVFADYQKYLDKLIASIQQEPVFIEYENASLRYYAAALKAEVGLQKGITDPAYYEFIKKLDPDNDKYMTVPEYIAFREACLHIQTNKNLSDDASEEECLDSILVNIQKIKSKRVREYFIFDRIIQEIEADAVDTTKYKAYFEKYNSDPVYAERMENSFNKKRALSPGKFAPAFTLADSTGNTVSLKNFKGKFIYIDFWATWCHPCMKEMPDYEKLQSDYKGKNIVFLSISLDNDKSKWLNFLRKNKREGNYLHADKGMDSEVAQAYQVSGVPLFVLIDKEGKLIEHSTSEPSSPEIRKKLDSLLSK